MFQKLEEQEREKEKKRELALAAKRKKIIKKAKASSKRLRVSRKSISKSIEARDKENSDEEDMGVCEECGAIYADDSPQQKKSGWVVTTALDGFILIVWGFH